MHVTLGGTGHIGSARALTPSGRDEPQQKALRITELYRREDGAWALVHRHTNALKSEDEMP